MSANLDCRGRDLSLPPVFHREAWLNVLSKAQLPARDLARLVNAPVRPDDRISAPKTNGGTR
ncbi:MAG TPA: hypothetical protein VNL38_02940 [Candidatus Nitrosotenuis sp.]|nr:hypothetical protein [Candidatus Nitrosotenuis sp.]